MENKKDKLLDILQKPLNSYKPILKPIQPKSPIQKTDNPTPRELKERPINPMAMRPENMDVTIKPENKKINIMKKLFGF